MVFQKELITDPQISFKRLTIDNGLSHDRTTDIVQDKNGYVWIGTTSGLNKYNGNDFEIFVHNPDNYTSISSGFIYCLSENRAGDLYIGTDKGLNKYNRKTNDFELIPIDPINRNPVIRQIYFDNDSILWIEIQEGYLIKFNVNKRSIIKSYKHDGVNQTYYLYHDIYRDKQGVLWIGLRNRPPMYLDETKDQIIVLPFDESDYTKKRASDMACYFEDTKGRFWFTALDGIYLFDRNSESFSKFLGTTTYDVHEDSYGNIWFASGSGVMRYNPDNDEIILMRNEKDNPHSISSNNTYKIMEDRMGNIWFATSKGVNIFSPPLYPFNHFTHIPGIDNSPEGYEVSAVARDNHSNLWIGYTNDGLDYFNRKKMTFTHFLQGKGNSLATNKVSSLYFDGKDLWIGLWRGIGFNKYEPDNNKFTLYTYEKNSLERDWYSDFAEDKYGNFYIGFWGADGLTPFNKEYGKFLPSMKHKFGRVECSRLITKMKIDHDQTLWFGTTDCGLHKYFPMADSGVSYFSDDANNKGLANNEIAGITIDGDGNIWIINEALQLYNRELDTFISVPENTFLGISDFTSIIADNSNNLWIGTSSNGLFKYSIDDQLSTHFQKDDGLHTNTFTDAALKLNSGELFFGTNNGFVIFEPENITENDYLPEPYFGKLYVYDHIFNYDVSEESEIVLEPDQNTFTIDLLSSDIVNSGRYIYICILEGYDRDWVEIDERQKWVRYASVPPGSYILKYKIGNRNGYWSESVASVDLVVKKHFYREWWFIFIIIVLISTVIILVVKQREFDLKQKNRNVELQQRLFRLQMNPHFMYNSLLAIQSFIFSHNPIEASNYISDFAKLFRLILNNSKYEFITLSKEIDTLNLYLKLQSLRYPDKFTYSINVDEDIDVELIMIPPMLAQPMLENALEHGLFYKEGKGHVGTTITLKGSQLMLEIKDNGIGLTRAKDMKKTGHKSTALQITRERIKILGKRHNYFAIFEIKELLNNEGEAVGTLVRFNLPVKTSLFDNMK